MSVQPNSFDDSKLVKIRAEQEDPIIQYYIVRTDVPMSIGKVCSQIAHAAQMFTFGYLDMKKKCSCIPSGGKPLLLTRITEQWMEGSFRKVVLGGKKKDFDKVKEKLDVFLVRDAGLTEIDFGTETVLVTWPIRKSQQPKLLSRLRLLKETK
jgi:peptidyl-tRNA hydrolase, PTH2 family